MAHVPPAFDLVTYGGSPTSDNHPLRVYLYPYRGDSTAIDACRWSGVVTTGLEDAFEHILTNTGIEGYEIFKWNGEEGPYPDFADVPVDHFDADDILSIFGSYLENEEWNGSANLKDYQGCHHLAHIGLWEEGGSCYQEGNQDGDYGGNDFPSGAQGSGNSFITAGKSWAPICRYNEGLTKGGTVQEVLHTFIVQEDAVDDLYPNYDEHKTGKVYTRSTSYRPPTCYRASCVEVYEETVVTPMLEFHWDDDYEVGHLPCSDKGMPLSSPVDAHDPIPTECTVGKVENTHPDSGDA